MFFLLIVLSVATWILTFAVGSVLQKQNDLPRIGVNPGPLNFRMWWAKLMWCRHGHRDVVLNYKKQKSEDMNYVVHTLMGDTIVLAPKFINELNMLPESKLSSTAALVDSVLGQYSGVDLLLRDHLTTDICRGSLTRHLPLFLPRMAEELQAVLNERVGQDCHNDSTATYIAFELLYEFIHRISSLVFVGKPYCYDKAWVTAVTDLPVSVEITKFLLLPFPSFLRRFIAPLIPFRNRIFHQRKAVRDCLFPPHGDTAQHEPSVMKLLVESGRDPNPDSITARLLLLTAAALHTSTMAATHALLDLCAMPEYIQPLRLEAEAALSHSDERWSFSTIKELRRLDSFLKESQRVNQPTFLGFDRKVTSSIRLSDGKTVLPRGATIAVAGGPMSQDDTFYHNPARFNGNRFYRAHKETTATLNSTDDYTGIEPGNLSWGSGRFTCPGRWYAAAMIKLIVANLLLEYDISFPTGQTDRPANKKYDTEIHPDFQAKIMLKKRKAP